MTTLHLCPTGWEKYDTWDKLSAANSTHEPTVEEATAENQSWTAYLDHKAACPECGKDENA